MTVLSAINIDDDIAKHVLPVGLMVSWAGDAAPSGWLLCAGQAISRTGTNSALFALLGTTYGSGDGSTTFNLPDCRGRVVIGPDNMGGAAAGRISDALIGSTGGVSGHTLTDSEMPSHSHGGVTNTMNAAGAHSHAGQVVYKSNNASYSVAAMATYNPAYSVFPVADTDTNHEHGVTVEGSATEHTNVQPSLATHIIIKI